MPLLAAIQPRRVEALVDAWAAADPEHWRNHARRLDETDPAFDRSLRHEVVDRTIAHLCRLLEAAGDRGCRLALLPETCLPVGPCRVATREALVETIAYAEPRWLERSADIARRYGLLIASCYYRAEGEKLYNDAVLMGTDGQVIGIYHKVHLPCGLDWSASEAALFEAGDEHSVFDTPIGRVGFQICYDIDFPEGCAALALNGAELILHPTVGYNFPDEEEVVAEARLRTRATDHSVPLVYSNFGPSPGRSAIFGANGAQLACCGRGVDGMAVADVDLKAKRDQHWGHEGYGDHRLTLARKRRPDTYGVLTDLSPRYLRDTLGTERVHYDYRPEVGLPTRGERRP